MPKGRQAGVKNRNYPALPLAEALKVARVIQDDASGMKVSRLTLAELLETTPTSRRFRELIGASRLYGLTEGGINADEFSLTQLGEHASGGDEVVQSAALKTAVMNVPPYRIFFETFKNKKMPGGGPLKEFLVRDADVDADKVQEVIDYISQDAATAGLLRIVKGGKWIDLSATPAPTTDADPEEAEDADPDQSEDLEPGDEPPKVGADLGGDNPPAPPAPSSDELKTNRKVFITHGKNKKIVDQLKELLTFGEFEPIVSVERDSVSKPVPTKVLDDMRSCSAAVIHVGIEQRLMDSKGQEQSVLNSNVLIEIGAAMMRYGTNFVLLVEDGTTLPSNLQGLYEVRYAGDELDYPSTMKLLKAFNDFKS